MTTEEIGARPRARRLRRLVTILLGSYLLYVAGFELAVRSGFAGRLLNRRPHKLQVAFASAHSWFPFWATVSGLEARGQAPRLRWQARVDRASGWLSPLPLVGRRIRLVGAHAAGVEIRVRYESATVQVGAESGDGEAAAGAAARVEKARTALRGFELVEPAEEELPLIPALAPPPAGPPRLPKWTIEVASFAARGVREVWFDRFRLRSELEASGALTLFLPTREIALGPARATFGAGTLTIGSDTVGEGLSGHADLTIARFPFQEKRGLAMLPFLTTAAKFEARLSSGRLVHHLLPPSEWLEIDPAPAAVSGELELEAGELRPGTRIEISQPGYEARAFDFRLHGDLGARVEVTSDESGLRADATARFGDFAVRRGDDERPDLVGTGLSVVATTRDLAIAGIGQARAAVKVDLGEARAPDLASVADLMPPSAELDLVGGSGLVRGGFDLELPAISGRGAIQARLEGVAVRYSGLDLAGRMQIDLALATAGLSGGRFDLAGSRIELTEFASPQLVAEKPPESEPPGGWWATIELPEGELTLPPAGAASGRLKIRLRDSVPFVGLFETRRNLPGWVERLLTVHDLAAECRFAAQPPEFALDDFQLPFRKSMIHARMRFGEAHKAGAMMIAWKRVALGLRFDDDRKQFKLVGVRSWYAKQLLDRPATAPAIDRRELFSEEALAAIPFAGVADRPVSLVEAEMAADEDEPGEESAAAGTAGATARAPFAFVPGSTVLGDLDGDGRDEAALLLVGDPGEREPALYLAVLAERDGRAANVATLALGDRGDIGALSIAGGFVLLDAGASVAPIAAEPPAESAPEPGAANDEPAVAAAAVPPPLRFRLVDGVLREMPPEPPPAPAAEPAPATPPAAS